MKEAYVSFEVAKLLKERGGVFGIDKGHERTDEWKYFYEIIFPRTFTIEYYSLCYNDGYSTYEEAVENGIKYTLENLI